MATKKKQEEVDVVPVRGIKGSIGFQIIGLSPLLMHSPAEMSNPHDDGVKVKTVPTREQEAEQNAYRNPNGTLYIPSEGFRCGILEKACTNIKIGKSSARGILQAAMFLLQDRCNLVEPESGEPITEYEIDSRRAVLKSAGRKVGVLRSRPRIREWATDVAYEIDLDFWDGNLDAASKTLLEFQSRAGKLAGIGDYRVQCGGPFGRYRAEIIKAEEIP